MSGRSSETHAKARKNGLKGWSGEWQGFVDVPLNSDDITAIQVIMAEREQPALEALYALHEDVYKVSITPDREHHCVVVAVTGRDKGKPGYGRTITARGPDMQAGLVAAWYKVFVKLANEEWPLRTNDDRQLPLWG